MMRNAAYTDGRMKSHSMTSRQLQMAAYDDICEWFRVGGRIKTIGISVYAVAGQPSGLADR